MNQLITVKNDIILLSGISLLKFILDGLSIENDRNLNCWVGLSPWSPAVTPPMTLPSSPPPAARLWQSVLACGWQNWKRLRSMGGATLSPARPGPHQILNKMTSGPHQKMTSVTRPHQWMATMGARWLWKLGGTLIKLGGHNINLGGTNGQN